MWRELVAIKNSASRVDDKRTHSARIVEAARDAKLPDGCSANTYLQKVNTLVADHMDYMENPYQGHAKGVFLIGLMPKDRQRDVS